MHGQENIKKIQGIYLQADIGRLFKNEWRKDTNSSVSYSSSDNTYTDLPRLSHQLCFVRLGASRNWVCAQSFEIKAPTPWQLLARNKISLPRMLLSSSIIWTPSPLCPFIPTSENFGRFKNVISVLFVLLKTACLEVEISRWEYLEKLVMRWRNLDGMNELSINSKYILPLQGEERIYARMWMF